MTTGIVQVLSVFEKVEAILLKIIKVILEDVMKKYTCRPTYMYVHKEDTPFSGWCECLVFGALEFTFVDLQKLKIHKYKIQYVRGPTGHLAYDTCNNGF